MENRDCNEMYTPKARVALYVNWKSKKKLDYELSPRMIDFLVNAVGDGKLVCNVRTMNALLRRELCDDEGNLTEQGKVVALAYLPLADQCVHLDIPLEEWHAATLSNPETTVLKTLNGQNSKAYFSENSFGTHVVHFFLFDRLLNLSRSQDKPLYSADITFYPEFFYAIKADLDAMLRSIDEHICKMNYHLIQQHMEERPGFFHETMWDLAFYEAIFNALGERNIRRIIEMYFSNPLAYYRGWPDIIVTGDKHAHFIEVKTTDTLHLSQLITIPDLVSWTGIPVKCVRLKKSVL